MNNAGIQAPAGWYPTANGELRYWDGYRWLDVPAVNVEARPERTFSRPETPGTRRTWRPALVIGLVAVLVALIGSGAIGWNAISKQQAAAAERQSRAEVVPEIEDAVRVMAQEHAENGLITGPILEVSCSPVDGVSMDDLDIQTTVFECFAANDIKSDGRMTGRSYEATMNWTTGSYTYGLDRS